MYTGLSLPYSVDAGHLRVTGTSGYVGSCVASRLADAGWEVRALCRHPPRSETIRIDEYLVRWAMRKYKRLKGRPWRARKFLADVSAREPGLFAHWKVVRANDWMVGAV